MDIRAFQDKLLKEKLLKELPFSLVEKNDLRNLKLYVSEVKPKPNLNIKNESGDPLIVQAAKKSTHHTLKILLDAGADTALQDDNGSTALMWAVDKGCITSVQALVNAKAAINTKNKPGKTALSYAAIRNNADIINELIVARADLQTKDKGGLTPLHYATKKSNCESVKILTEAKADVTARTNNGWTPFWLGFPYSNVEYLFTIGRLIKNAPKEKPGRLFKPNKDSHQPSSRAYSKLLSSDEKTTRYRP